MQLPATETGPAIRRLKRAHGHLGHVIKLLEDGASCEEVLTQLAAASKAISRGGYALVTTALTQCVGDNGQLDPDQAQAMEKLFLALA